MFSLPQGATSGKNSEGTCDEYPIHLEHIKRKDWECLLGLLFNSNSQVLGQASIPDFTLDEWESVLNLSTKWEMAAVRECAIEKINQFDNPAKKIQLARNYRVPRFFLPCLVQLVARSDPIIPQELSELGIECALKLVSIRERIYNGNNNYATFRPEKAPLDASTPGSTVWNNTVAVLHAIFTDHDEHYK
ncbi:hypothetical protein GYMLUDRAFT_227655 [Collybiopsis luxurians FD-317 M1]|uniref:Uncharacterized protein n=1 Tax=Collybiopsis luxurians FD-317 M1 TaxID=944289 RepID=A0A0D0BU42_9AGAR|nr:hypothetical protein GYMLUDRAFT_227655 [Collybiopsis luxurians FD-317 M1]